MRKQERLISRQVAGRQRDAENAVVGRSREAHSLWATESDEKPCEELEDTPGAQQRRKPGTRGKLGHLGSSREPSSWERSWEGAGREGPEGWGLTPAFRSR